ncbi:MAG: hypothetical protein L0215_09290 [Gemmataceae bacterium]|nr:hypothetical protein [Gemmataceae bacterium]
MRKDIKLHFVPIKGDDGPIVSESPIANIQYQVAIRYNAVPAPALPSDLEKTKCAEVAWKNGTYPRGQANNVVLFVNMHEARAYCRWLENMFPAYDFRLPNSSEAKDMELQWSNQGYNGRKSDSYPRPASGPNAHFRRERFWLAPFTLELVEEDEIHAAMRKFAEKSGFPAEPLDPDRRFTRLLWGSPFGPTVLPNTLRVVAVKKGQR